MLFTTISLAIPPSSLLDRKPASSVSEELNASLLFILSINLDLSSLKLSLISRVKKLSSGECLTIDTKASKDKTSLLQIVFLSSSV